MARTLPGGMAANITATGAQPSLSVLASNYLTLPTLLADTGSSTDLNYKTRICVATTGTVIVSLVDQSVSPSTVKIRRITNLATPSQWTAVPTSIATGAQPLAGARCFAVAGTIRCCYQRASDLMPVYRDSTDDGVTWGAETVLGPGTLPLTLGNFIDDFYAIGITTVWVDCRSSGPLLTGASGLAKTVHTTSWSAWTIEQPTGGQGQIRSLDFIPNDSANPSAGGIFVGGIQRRNLVTGLSLGDWSWNGATHGAVSIIAPNDNPSSGLSYTAAAAGQAKSGQTQYVLGCLIDDGSISTNAHQRGILYSRAGSDTTDGHWAELATLPGAAMSPYGATLALAGSLLYIVTGKTVYTVPVSSSPATTDLSADVLSLHVTEATSRPTRATLVLANTSNGYSSTAWATQSLTVALGYSGTTLLCWTLYVEDFRILYVGDVATVTLDLVDASLFLERISTRLDAVASTTVGTLLARIAAQIPLPLTTDATAPFSATVPCFVTKPGDSPLAALNRLADLYDLQFRIGGTPSVTVLDLASRQSDPSTWSYGSEALAVATGLTVDQPNVIRVVGGSSTAWSEVQDDSQIAAVGRVIYRHIVDRLVSTATDATTRANAALRTEQRSAAHAQLTVTVNPQHEVMDVIDVTDARLGLASTHYRIEAIATHIDWQAGTWQQALTLALP